ncbi:MAG: peptidylprolyl isomerase [Alphaproteobacteria bacterium]|nr:peptidylprolyl isomerase [Alphaproteobacteria bacterium]
MMKISHFIAACLMVSGISGGVTIPKTVYAQSGISQQIAAVVNEDVISVDDVRERLMLVMASSGLPNTPDIRGKLAPQIMQGLIDEKLMVQEAKRLNVAVDEAEVQKGFGMVAQQNGQSAETFKGMLQRGGLSLSTMYAQIGAQMAWGKVVQADMRPKVVISDRDVDDVLERLKRAAGSDEYLVAEIFIPFGDAKSEKDAQQLASGLVKEIRGGKAEFFKLAQQFSKAAGSANGGDLGWLAGEQIDPDMLAALKKVSKGQATDPVKTTGGYHIYLLRDKRAVSTDTIPSREQVFNMLGQQRLDRMQRRRLMDLRAASFVEVRG